MGLNIIAYRQLKPVQNPTLDEDGYPISWEAEWKPGTSMKWSENIWPGRGEGISPDTVYTFDDKFDFRAGSYNGYNRWREKLEEFADGRDLFLELINFADNEGVIGPIVSAKLAIDFMENAEAAISFANARIDESEHEWWLEKYSDWRKAFEMASDNGAVDFG